MSARFSLARIFFFVSILALSACSTIGESDFSCPGRPAGVSCMSATEVYRKTDANTDAVKSTTKQQQTVGMPNFVHTAAVMPAVNRPIPIRTPAQVMRVWLAPWEDTRGILHAGGYSFIEIESRRWSLGETPVQTEPVRLFSIQKPTLEPKKESGGKSPPAQTARAGASERSKPSSPTSTSGASK